MRRAQRRAYRALADINIANLVDVVLVLLIIFMISAPLLQSGIEVDLPQTRAAAVNEQAEGIVVTIDRKGGIFINDVWAKQEDFEDRLKDVLKSKGTSTVYLRADSTVMYGLAIGIIGRMKEIGVEEIGLVTALQEKPAGRRAKK